MLRANALRKTAWQFFGTRSFHMRTHLFCLILGIEGPCLLHILALKFEMCLAPVERWITNLITNSLTNSLTHKLANKLTNEQTNKQTNKQTN